MLNSLNSCTICKNLWYSQTPTIQCKCAGIVLKYHHHQRFQSKQASFSMQMRVILEYYVFVIKNELHLNSRTHWNLHASEDTLLGTLEENNIEAKKWMWIISLMTITEYQFKICYRQKSWSTAQLNNIRGEVSLFKKAPLKKHISLLFLCTSRCLFSKEYL